MHTFIGFERLSSNLFAMAKKFFPDDWESISKEELANSRAHLSGFIESTTEKEKTIRDVSIDFRRQKGGSVIFYITWPCWPEFIPEKIWLIISNPFLPT